MTAEQLSTNIYYYNALVPHIIKIITTTIVIDFVMTTYKSIIY